MPATDGSIELSLPADSRFMRLARLMASGVATSVGLPLEEVEDFRIAVDELCATLIEMGDGDPLRLVFESRTIRRRAGHDRMASTRRSTTTRLALSRQILDVVTDGHDLAQTRDGWHGSRPQARAWGGVG